MTISRTSGNYAIDNFILGEHAHEYSHEFISDDAVPYCDKKGRRICSPKMPPIINADDDTIVRAKNEHEAGHGRFTPSDMPSEWGKAKCHLVNILEDLRIERGLATLSPVFGDDLSFLNNYLIGKIQAGHISGEMKQSVLMEAFTMLHIHGNGQDAQWMPDPMAQTLYDAAVDEFDKWMDASYTDEAGFYQIVSVADKVLDIFNKLMKDEKNNAKDESEKQESGNNASSDDENSGPNVGGDSKANGDNDQCMLDNQVEDSPFENEMKKTFKRISEESKKEFGEYTSYTDEDTVVPAEENKETYEQSRASISAVLSGLAGRLEQALRSKSRVRKAHGLQQGRLDTMALHKLARPLSMNVFTRNETGMSLKSTVVSILIDESGSIGEEMSAEFRKLGIALSEAFDRLGIRFEILGHTTSHSSRAYKIYQDFSRVSPMRILEHKTFGESYKAAKYKLGSITYNSANVDGEALLTTAQRNFAQRASRHIVMVLSDGAPSCICRDDSELREHLTNTVKMLRGRGMEIYAFGISTKDPQKYYGESNFVYVKDASNINEQFIRRLEEIVVEGGMTK